MFPEAPKENRVGGTHKISTRSCIWNEPHPQGSRRGVGGGGGYTNLKYRDVLMHLVYFWQRRLNKHNDITNNRTKPPWVTHEAVSPAARGSTSFVGAVVFAHFFLTAALQLR